MSYINDREKSDLVKFRVVVICVCIKKWNLGFDLGHHFLGLGQYLTPSFRFSDLNRSTFQKKVSYNTVMSGKLFGAMTISKSAWNTLQFILWIDILWKVQNILYSSKGLEKIPFLHFNIPILWADSSDLPFYWRTNRSSEFLTSLLLSGHLLGSFLFGCPGDVIPWRFCGVSYFEEKEVKCGRRGAVGVGGGRWVGGECEPSLSIWTLPFPSAPPNHPKLDGCLCSLGKWEIQKSYWIRQWIFVTFVESKHRNYYQ